MRSSEEEPFDTSHVSLDLELALIFMLSCCLALLTFGCGPRKASVNTGAANADKAVTNVASKSIALANVAPDFMALTNLYPEYGQWYRRVNTTNYDEWVKRFVEQPMRLDVRMGITTVTGEEYASGATNQAGEDAYFAHRYEFGCTVYTNGGIIEMASGPHGGGGGPMPQLSDDDLRHLDALLAKLPDDGSHLPPPGRRVAVWRLEKNRWRTWVYDGSNAPPQIAEIRRIIRDFDVPVR